MRIASISAVVLAIACAIAVVRVEPKASQKSAAKDQSGSKCGPSSGIASCSPETDDSSATWLAPVRSAPTGVTRIQGSITPTQSAQVAEKPPSNGEGAAERRSRQKAWRRAYASERQDAEWTHHMQEELQRLAADFLDDRTMLIHQLSCRETVCRMYLQFDDQLDAAAFQELARGSAARFEFQSLDPDFNGEGFDRSNYTYEVMVQRSRPEGLPAHDPTEAGIKKPLVVQAGDDATIVVTANGYK